MAGQPTYKPLINFGFTKGPAEFSENYGLDLYRQPFTIDMDTSQSKITKSNARIGPGS